VYNRGVHRLIRIASLSLSSAGAACAEWPRFAHLPSPSDAAPASLDTGPDAAPATVSWLPAVEEAEPNDTLGSAVALAVGEGIIRTGALTGLGWDEAGAPPAVDSGCAQGAFPPASPGMYSGDLDWLSVLPAEAGRLCAELRFEDPPEGLYVDLAPYSLDACAVPEALLDDRDSGLPAGLSLPGDGAWAVDVGANRATAIALAGFLPRDLDLAPAYQLRLSLLSADEAGTCPRSGAR
jgi:hypothetical protein